MDQPISTLFDEHMPHQICRIKILNRVTGSIAIKASNLCYRYKPLRDKINNVAVRPAKTQISLGIRPVWSESLLSASRKLGPLAIQWAQRRLWSDWANAQADLSLRWMHSHIVGFVTRRLIYNAIIHLWTWQRLIESSLVLVWQTEQEEHTRKL